MSLIAVNNIIVVTYYSPVAGLCRMCKDGGSARIHLPRFGHATRTFEVARKTCRPTAGITVFGEKHDDPTVTRLREEK